MPTKKILLLMTIIIFLGTATAEASSISPRNTIILGDDIDYPPFSFLDEFNNPTGFNIELAKAVAEVMGFDVKFQLDSWHQVVSKLENKEIDGIAGMFHSDLRLEKFAFTARHSVASGDIFTRDDLFLNSIEDLEGAKVVVQANDIVYESLLKEDLNIDFIEVATITEALKYIASGEYDYAAVLKIPAYYIIQHNKLTNIKASGLNLTPHNYSMAVAKENDLLLAQLNEGLIILKETGKYQEIYDKWLGIYEEKSYWDILQHYYWVFIVVLMLLILLLMWNFTLKKSVASRTLELVKANKELQESKKEILFANKELETLLKELSATEAELRKHYEDLRESEEKFRTLITQMQQGLALHEAQVNKVGEVIDYIFLDINDSFEKLTGLKRENILGKPVLNVLPDIGEYWINKYGQVAITGKPVYDEVFYKEMNKYFEVIAYQPRPMQFAVIVNDISQRKLMETQLEYLSYHDQLTDLYNRRFFEKILNSLDHLDNLPLSIVMADVNGLKLTNDAFGHTTGDKLLKKIAEILKKGCRTNDIVARLGGDEFVVLLPKTDSYETEKIINRLTDLLSKEKIESIDLSVSFGWATKKSLDEDLQEIVEVAENNMYKKKLYEGPSTRSKTIEIIIHTLHEKSKREKEHSHRVSELCSAMGKALGLSESKIQELKTVGLLHDIGKIAINEEIFNKPGKLTDEEWKEIKRHPEIGYRILSSVNEMSEMAEFVLAHHERWDGKGYPKGLLKDEIPLQARIIAIANAYDSMTSQCSYRNPFSREEALQEINRCSGTQFDPNLVKIFLQIFQE